jgi:putative ABC transport system ATP-binding protein
MNRAILEITDLTKEYENGLIKALQGVSFQLFAGETVAIMGPSGCGKSTLLGLIGLLDLPTRGRVLFNGNDLLQVKNPFAYRAQAVGFVFQFHYLIPTMTLLENVAAPMASLGVPISQRRSRALELLEKMNLAHRASCFPHKVSGGERQRAAVARALINRPTIVLADEPTGNLDTTNGTQVIDLLLNCASTFNSTVLIATHNPDVAARSDRVIEMRDGMITAIAAASTQRSSRWRNDSHLGTT